MSLTIISDVGADPAAAAMDWLAQPEAPAIADARAAGHHPRYEWSLNRGDGDQASTGHLVIMAYWTGGHAVVGRWAWSDLGALECASRIAYALKAEHAMSRFAPLYPTQIVREHGAAPGFEHAFAEHTALPVDIEDAGDGTPRFRRRCACGGGPMLWYATADEAHTAHSRHRSAYASAAHDDVSRRYPIPSAV